MLNLTENEKTAISKIYEQRYAAFLDDLKRVAVELAKDEDRVGFVWLTEMIGIIMQYVADKFKQDPLPGPGGWNTNHMGRA